MGKFADCFAEVTDPRGRNAQHDFIEILFIALLAQLCGAESCVDMADFADAKSDVLGEVLDLKYGTPSHDTFSRVFRLLDPVSFEAGFRRFTAAFGRKLRAGSVVAIDGKAVRGAYEHGRKSTPLHLVNVWAAGTRMAIGQATAPGRAEVQGVLDVLALLDLSGCLVTADALHCRADVAQAILDTGANYVLALKANHPTLLADANAQLGAKRRSEAQTSTQVSHGRLETRRATVVRAGKLAEKHDFPKLAAIACVTAERTRPGHETQISTRIFLLSKPVSAKRLLTIVRQHWQIENSLHWVLDVTLGEDRARNRKDHGPENIAILRKTALNLLQNHPDKQSIRRKIKRAGWDNGFLLSLLANMR
jgi:predicted transposase YbfD/YdcC